MLDRRALLTAGALLGAGASIAGPRQAAAQERGRAGAAFEPDVEGTQTAALQTGIDAASIGGDPLVIPPGRYRVGALTLKKGARIEGVPGRTVLEFAGSAPALLTAEGADNISLFGLVLDGADAAFDSDSGALISLTGCPSVDIRQCRIERSVRHGILLRKSGGAIADCTLSQCAGTSIFSHDAVGLWIAHNLITDSGDNAIQVWRSEKGMDGTIVTANRIERVATRSGGSGQNGNGVTIFRAGGVVVSGNSISDCAYSAIRCNSGSDIQMIGNSCLRSGENALYAEFAFDGALIANNVVDGASIGISITNFGDHGGRLAIAQGNLIRNLTGKMGTGPGIGIAVEADTVLTGNVIENAPRIGISIGWINALRDVTATGNFIRDAGVGIVVQTGLDLGRAFVVNNMITGAKNGAIRARDGDKLIGPDLARASPEAFPNLAVFQNVSG